MENNKFKNSKIYAIKSFKTDQLYIGSTIDKLCKRFSNHKQNKKSGRGCSANQMLDYDDAYIELIENYPCNTYDELLAREKHHIRENKDKCVNLIFNNKPVTKTPITGEVVIDETKKTADRKAYDKEYNKKYYENKKKEVKEITCNKCYGHYNYYSKSKHEKSARHLKALDLNKTI